MNTYSTFNLLFFIRKERTNSDGEAPIFLRITINGKRAEISIKRYIDPNKWDNKANKAKGNKPEIKKLNSYLDIVKNKIYDHHREMVDRNEFITAQNLKNRYLGISISNKSLIEAFKYHNKIIQEQIGSTYAQATYDRYSTTLEHLKKFLRLKYKKDDIFLKELNYSFIADLEQYFKVKRKCNHNTTIKYLKNFRKVINLAIKNEWLQKDPFAKYKATFKQVKRDFLTKEELNLLEAKKLKINRLDIVKDIFVFCCYTGLSFIDVDNLTKYNIRKGIDGRDWIFTKRRKTKNESNVPLLAKSKEIIKKYEHHPLIENTDRILPPISNQKLNAYLKEIADLCEIEKNLTFHIARHTFATTVTLTQGVSIEAISSMLGHKNIRTTQIYSKVVNQKVSDEMKKIK